MQPGLAHGEKILVDRLAFSSTPPSIGDVIVLLDPGQPGIHCVKRVIGLPGEHVRISNGVVLIDDRPLHEPYLAKPAPTDTPSPGQWRLGNEEYLVLGDFRQDSRDSRSFGPIDASHIVGKAWIRYWPLKAGPRIK